MTAPCSGKVGKAIRALFGGGASVDADCHFLRLTVFSKCG